MERLGRWSVPPGLFQGVRRFDRPDPLVPKTVVDRGVDNRRFKI
jgi:hypothetical protein